MSLSDGIIKEIKTYGLMYDFTPDECRTVLAGCSRRLVPRDEVLFARGQIADEVAWIIHGRARATLPGPHGDIDVMEFGPGSLVGFIGFIAQDQHQLKTRATEDLTLLVLDRSDFAKANARRDPLFARLMMAMSLGALDRVNIIQRAALTRTSRQE